MDAPLFAASTLLLRCASGLVVLLTLAHLVRRAPHQWLREWLFAWSSWLAASGLALIAQTVVPRTSAGSPGFILVALSAGCSVVAATLLISGAGEWTGVPPARAAMLRRRAGLAGILGVSLAVAVDVMTGGQSLQIALATAGTGVAAATGCIAVVVRSFSSRRASSSAVRVIVVGAFGAVALLELGFSVHVTAVATGLVAPAGFGWPVIAELLVFAALSVGMVILVVDDEREAAVSAASQVEHLAYHDPLSGLPNRSLFFDRLVVALSHAQRHKHKVAVLFLDLDRFKMINDSLGHSAGDGVIRQAAERLRRCVRKEDTIARFGGDEFIVLLQIIGRAEDASRVAQKILEAFTPPFDASGREIVLTASVGIAIYPSDGADAETIVRNADTAMYRAKELGHHSYRFYAPAMNAKALEQLELESDLRRAVASGEFVLHYQPLIDLKDGRVYGLEALLRWNHPTYGLLAPDRFIETAESSGLIVPIGNWVLGEACRQARSLQRTTGLDLVMSVNLSMRQFEQPDLASRVRVALHESGLRGRNLELEITESVAMKDIESTVRILHELKQLGLRVAIDDFGTGYSSLSYLRQLPVDTLKLDQSFVREITVPEDGAIASGVIAMAHSLRLTVLAEGVETLGQLEFLRDHQCDRLQGFLFSRPLEISMLEKFLGSGGGKSGIRVA